MSVRNQGPPRQVLRRLVASGAVSLVEEHSISRCRSRDAFCLVYRICSVVHSRRRCAFAVLLTQNRAPSHEVQSISGTKLAQSCHATGTRGLASLRTALGRRNAYLRRNT